MSGLVPLAAQFQPRRAPPPGRRAASRQACPLHRSGAKQPVAALASRHRRLPSPRGILCRRGLLHGCAKPQGSAACGCRPGGREPGPGTQRAPGTGAGGSSALAAHPGMALPLLPVTG